MNGLREIVEHPRSLRGPALDVWHEQEKPQPLGPSRWDWSTVERILLVRLRSIGDTVLATPSLFALKRFLPQAQVDILVENWVAPVLAGSAWVDNVITLERKSILSRAQVARRLRLARYDVVYNLHGGTTATFLTRATGARHRVGYATYQYSQFHNHLSPSPLLLWGRERTHSVEQQLALLGWTGVPVTDRPPTQLGLVPEAVDSITEELSAAGLGEQQPFALIHPAAAFTTKQWATEKFARLAEQLAEGGLVSVVLVTQRELALAAELEENCRAPLIIFDDLSLPEVTALASQARLFVGNDSGIAHIAAARGVPAVVIFGSSNRAHWRPWTQSPAEVVYEEMPCQPCHGYFCEKFERPECIVRVPVERVFAAIERILRNH